MRQRIECRILTLLSVLSIGHSGCTRPDPELRPPLVQHVRLDQALDGMCDGLVRALEGAYEVGDLRRAPHYLAIGIMPFRENGERPRARQLGRLVADELAVCLVERHRLRLVERARRTPIRQEVARGDYFEDPRATAALGQRVGADLMVLGAVSDGGDEVLVSLRVVRVRDEAIVAGQSQPLPADPLVDRALHLFDRKSRWGAVARGVLLPGWGQAYNDQPVKAAAAVVTELSLLGLAVGFHVAGRGAEERYGVQRRDTVPDRALANDRYELRDMMLILAGAVRVASLVDAWLDGYEYSPDLLRPQVRVGPLGGNLLWRF